MTVAAIVRALFVSLDVDELGMGQISALLEPFELEETTVRSTLSRLSSRKTIEVRREGRRAFYHLTSQGLRVRYNTAFHLKGLDWEGWDGMYRAVAFSTSGQELRYRLTKKLTAHRYAPLFPGFWIRPWNGAESVFPGDTGIAVNATALANGGAGGVTEDSSRADHSRLNVMTVKFESPPDIDRLRLLYDVSGRGAILAAGIDRCGESIRAMDRGPATDAFVEYLQVGSDLVSRLSSDPLLPAVIVGTSWPGDALRERFREWVSVARRRMAPFTDPIIHSGEV